MNLYEETKFLMKKYNLSANKNLGQNFLIDEEVINKIVDASETTKEDLVIEIGPGLGSLTKKLLEKAGKVISVELDQRMVEILKDRFFMYNNFEIIYEDILKVDLEQLIEENKKQNKLKNVKIVANLPYYITTPIIMKLLEDKLEIESITVMIQKEVAERLCDIPGGKKTGAITYSVYYYAEAKQILTVPNNSFIPEPEVTSEVIKLKIRKEPIIKVNNEKMLFKIIKIAFMQRRKTLVNAIASSDLFSSKEEIIECLNKLNIPINIRGEKLTIEQYADITNYIINTSSNVM